MVQLGSLELQYYQLSEFKLATVKSFKADILRNSPLSEGMEGLKDKFISNRHSQFPWYQRALFIKLIYSCFLITIFPPIV